MSSTRLNRSRGRGVREVAGSGEIKGGSCLKMRSCNPHSRQEPPMTDQAMSPLRRRMIEDMTIRKFAPKTQHDYLQRVKNFTAYLRRSPDTASSEDVRRYQLHLTASGVGVPTVNQTDSTLRFFFKVTLRR